MRVDSYLIQRGMRPDLAPAAAALLDVLTANGVRYTITSVYRSIEKQASLYDRYLKGQHQYPVAPPGQSLHNYGLAMDVVMPDWAYSQLGAIWRSWGGFWTPADRIHFAVR